MIVSTLSLLPFSASANDYSGKCGEHVYYDLDSKSGTIFISGEGDMFNYTMNEPAPWSDFGDAIKSVVIEYGVTNVGNYAFSNYQNIASVRMENSVTKIGTAAFNNCSSLKSINIPHGVTTIAMGAFINCSSATFVSIPKSVTSISNTVFLGCSSLSLVFYAGTRDEWNNVYVSNIDNEILFNVINSDNGRFNAFGGFCGDDIFFAIDLNQGYMEISGTGAIDNYPNDSARPWDAYGEQIKTVVIYDGVTVIGSFAFDNMPVENVTISKTVERIGDMAFNNTTLQTVNYEGSKADWNAVYVNEMNEPLLNIKPQTVVNGICGENVLYSFDTETGALLIGGEGNMFDYGSTKSFSPFYNRRDIKTVTFIGNVTHIGNYAFLGCPNLTEIEIGESVKTIGHGAFMVCTALEKVVIKGDLELIDDGAFSKCAAITTLEYGKETVGVPAMYDSWEDVLIGPGNDALIAIKPQTIRAQGDCGEGVTYKIYNSGAMEINGSGAVDDYSAEKVVPWQLYQRQIRKVFIGYGVTRIGDNCFSKNDIMNLQYASHGGGTESSWNKVSVGENNEALLELLPQTKPAEPENPEDPTPEAPYDPYSDDDAETPYIIVLDFNGGNRYGEETYVVKEPRIMTEINYDNFIILYEVTPPEGKVFDGVEVNGERYEIGQQYDQAQDTVYKYLWKDDTTVVHKHVYEPVITKASLTANGYVERKCECGKVAGKATIYSPKTFTLSASTYTYDGKVKAPGVTVKDSVGTTLKKGTDYTLTYSAGRKNVGKYSVKVVFTGKYKGSKTLTFKINPKGTSISSLSAQKAGKIKVKWKQQTAQTTGYSIQYATDSGFTKNVKTVENSSNKSTEKTITGLKRNVKYYVRIRTYKTVNGTKYYSAWSSSKSVKTKR